MRFIDADELKTHKVYSSDLAEKVVSVAHIDWAKTIEAKPVIHAEWVKKNENLDGTITYECSNCEHEIGLEASPWHYDVYYCEACGANMGLDKDEV